MFRLERAGLHRRQLHDGKHLPAYQSIDGKDELHNYVILGSEDPYTNGGVGGFVFQPVYTVLNGTVNFYDNTIDTGGSPPGGPDDLVLGYHRFHRRLLNTTLIGIDTVFVDASPARPARPSMTMARAPSRSAPRMWRPERGVDFALDHGSAGSNYYGRPRWHVRRRASPLPGRPPARTCSRARLEVVIRQQRPLRSDARIDTG